MFGKRTCAYHLGQPVPYRARPGLEILEDRLAPATVSFSGGVLSVWGTAAADRVVVAQTFEFVNVGGVALAVPSDLVVRDDGEEIYRIDPTLVRSVQVQGGRGDDSFTNGSGIPCVANGGKGNDTLIGGGRNDVLNGGKGHDSLQGGGGNDVLVGGNGRDWLDGGAGTDTLQGGKGGDNLFGDAPDVPATGWARDFLYGQGGDDDLYYNGPDEDGAVDGGSGQNTYWVRVTSPTTGAETWLPFAEPQFG